ncbi:hypothetical protein [Rhodoferax sp.]|uniref:hypothetical protein n=1 Tax=Rhodoferax sp. TaxID=50421 RepID=UPI00262CC359|nr:hypothetical protein [Rhodoferax sp.]MDD2917813.1 hypothetical protein [Rhodoferax sp.]
MSRLRRYGSHRAAPVVATRTDRAQQREPGSLAPGSAGHGHQVARLSASATGTDRAQQREPGGSRQAA